MPLMVLSIKSSTFSYLFSQNVDFNLLVLHSLLTCRNATSKHQPYAYFQPVVDLRVLQWQNNTKKYVYLVILEK